MADVAIDAAVQRWNVLLERRLRVACADRDHWDRFVLVCQYAERCARGDLTARQRDSVCEDILAPITVGDPPRRAFSWFMSPGSWSQKHWEIVYDSVRLRRPPSR